MRKGAFATSVYGDNPNMCCPASVFSDSYILYAVIRSIRQGLNISLFHTLIKGKLDSSLFGLSLMYNKKYGVACSPRRASPAPVSIRSRCVKRFVYRLSIT